MSKKNGITKEQAEMLVHKVELEGFDYCFTGYSSWKEIKDDEFQKLRKAYVDSAKALQMYVDSLSVRFDLDV